MLRHTCSFAGAIALGLVIAAPGASAADKIPAAVAAAVADAGRPDTDKARDANRKPAEVVAFSGIKAGDHVAELLPGAGYFTRIISKVVGDKGVVFAITPPPRPDAQPGQPPAVAALTETYKNIKVSQLSPTQIAPEPVDVVWTSDNYHDLHNRPNADLVAFNKSVFAALKPGGTYIVIDHAAEKGSGARDTNTLHRIDPEIVKQEVTAAGFTLDSTSDALQNKEDPHTAGVRDPSIQGHTDQFALKFRKPKK
jgi:predicted methyltransferase